MDHAEQAGKLFLEGYNCAQAVVCAFSDVTGLDEKSGALLVLGILYGYDDPKDYEAKKAHYQLVQEFARRFREINGTIICRELLKNVKVTPGGQPEERTPEYYKRRPCLRHVMEAASIVDEMCREREQEKRGEQSSDRNMGAEDQIAGGHS